MLSKDAFWNCENVTVYDSFISGEYLGWNSKNITFINCTIESLQGMCYIDNLVMKNCLNELRFYMEENRKLAAKFIESELPKLYLVPAHATYLLWIDCRLVTEDTSSLCQFICEETGLYISAGESYGETGKGFIRINIACPRERMKDGLTRLKKGIELYKKFLEK